MSVLTVLFNTTLDSLANEINLENKMQKKIEDPVDDIAMLMQHTQQYLLIYPQEPSSWEVLCKLKVSE